MLEVADLGKLIAEWVSFALRGSNVDCETNVDDGACALEIDVGQIHQVVNNLVLNAQQAMPDGGKVRVRLENVSIAPGSALPMDPGDYVRLSVEDTGAGIPVDQLAKVFDPFYTTKSMGSGLGLSTCHSIIRQHDGWIDVHSVVGSGTTFEIYLPAAVDQTRDQEKAEQGVQHKQGRVLVLDDEQGIRRVVTRLLSSLGYEAVAVAGGEDVIETYERAMEEGTPFDLVILDLTIPGGMGGKETIERLVEIDPEVKAVVSSGYSNDPVIADFSHYGFSGCIDKPYSIAALSAALREVLDR